MNPNAGHFNPNANTFNPGASSFQGQNVPPFQPSQIPNQQGFQQPPYGYYDQFQAYQQQYQRPYQPPTQILQRPPPPPAAWDEEPEQAAPPVKKPITLPPATESKSVSLSIGGSKPKPTPPASKPSSGASTPKEPAAPVSATPHKKETKAEKAAEKAANAEKSVDQVAKDVQDAADQSALDDLYGQDAGHDKLHINIVFIGHVDAGKSTMGGNLLYLSGMVDQRTMEKYERESKAAGRETWALSWALDSTTQERDKGITVEVGRAFFETPSRRYTILDAPGHKNFVPNMISGAAQADVAVLVISARKGEFETGFEKGGQTREHAMLVRTAGVQRLIVVVNKMDESTVQWSKERYDEIVGKMTPFIKTTGFSSKMVTFIPVSAFTGANLKEVVKKDACSWYNGPSLLGLLDSMPLTDRDVHAPLVMPISEKYRDMGTMIVGKIEAGRLRKGSNLLVMPNKTPVEVTAIYNEMEEEVPSALAGDNVRIRLRGIEEEDVAVGFVLCDARKPVHAVTQFQAQLAILEHKNIICAGYSAVLHVHTVAEEIQLTALLHYYDKKTGKKSRKPPQFAKKGQKIVALIETQAPICIEKFDTVPALGRFTLRDEGKTIAIGKVTKLTDKEEFAAQMASLSLANPTA